MLWSVLIKHEKAGTEVEGNTCISAFLGTNRRVGFGP